MATNDEILEALSDNLKKGVAERQIADRRERYFSPNEVLAAIDAANYINAANSSPFIKVGLSGSSI